MSAFDYHMDRGGIVTLTMQMQGSVNRMNDDFRQAMAEAVKRLEEERGLKGVVLASAKETFFAGGDLNELLAVQKGDEVAFHEKISAMKALLRRLEKLPVPVVAAINGAALGGGYELALACHRRIVVDRPAAVVGLPEVTLGLLPGAGGIVRLVSMLGLEKALPVLLEGAQFKPSAALQAGLVDQVVPDPDALMPAAKAWITAQQERVCQPWDSKGFKLPGGNALAPRNAPLIAAASAMIAKKTRGLLPAPEKILGVAAEASLLDFDAALEVETRYLAYLATTPQAKNIVTTMFFQMNEINAGKSRPQEFGKFTVRRLGVLGAGMMGQGIAYCAAKVGIEVTLLDVSLDAAIKGKSYSEKLLATAVAKGRLTQEKADSTLALICPTDRYEALAGVDFIVEAVFEGVELKAKVTQQAQPHLAAGGVFGSNTSTLPIGLLASAALRPENFIGTHFFSPVDKMPLVEIICGEQTSRETLAKAFDFARQLGKTAIIVKDRLGFFTSRTFGTYLDEACRLLQEGVDPATIENLSRQLGMPAAPLAVFDEVSLELMRKVNDTHKTMGVFGSTYDVSASDAVGNLMIKSHGRGGRQYGGGFYEYPENGEKYLWTGLAEVFGCAGRFMPREDIQDRLMFRQVLEACRCLDEGVLESAADGNVGSILGIGAPVWTGGFIQFVNGYGIGRFMERAHELERKYGARFQVPGLLKAKAAAGELLN